MEAEWDPGKARLNRQKHGVRFADALHALEDNRALTIVDDATGEERFVTLGRDLLDRVLVVVWTPVDPNRVRLISARKATGSERQQYRGKP